MTTPSQSTAYKRDLPGVVAAMMRPEIYRDHPRSIESRQTHISYVFLAGDYVYKIKKPVRFSFLDASLSPGAINYVWTKYGLTGDSRQTSTWASLRSYRAAAVS